MFHISDLGEFAHKFFADKDGQVPEHGDHWGHMKIDHGDNDPSEEGISDEERKRRVDYLNEQWWPNVIAQVNQEKETLSQLHGGTFTRKWHEATRKDPPTAQGFHVEY